MSTAEQPGPATTRAEPAGRPLRRKGTSALVFAWIWTVLVGCAAIGFVVATSATSGRNAGDVHAIGALVMLGALLIGFIALVPAGALFASWLNRAQANASVRSGTAPPMPEEWAVVGCFVPIANLVVPELFMKHVAKASGVSTGLVAGWSTAWVGAWLAFWLGFPIIGAPLGTSPVPMWVTAVLFVVAAAFLTTLVNQIGRHLEPRAA